MLWAIFSDIHSNLPAFEAVLGDIRKERADRLLCLGDIVGYGPHPREVLDLIQTLECPSVVGNHDLAAIDQLDASCFNVFARQAIDWTADQLTEPDRIYLGSLPATLDLNKISAVHGTRDHPGDFLYLQTLEHADALMGSQPRILGVYGHTHVPVAFLKKGRETSLAAGNVVELRGLDRALVNVGSVGQPRDEDPRAAYALFDDEKLRVEVRRVAYDTESVRKDIYRAGLPRLLADRLPLGV